MALRDWQKKALSRFLKKKKIILEVCTGAGKTFFSITAIREILKTNPNYKVLIVVPKIVILKQWFKEFKDNGFTIDQIGVFYGEIKEFSQITITTTSSLEKVLDMLWNDIDVCIFDEAHNMYSKNKLKLLDVPCEYKIGLSASIINETGKHWKVLDKFDYNKFTYDLGDAIQDNIVNRFVFHHVGVKLDSISLEKLGFIETEKNKIIAACGGFHSYISLPETDKRKQKIYSLIKQREEIVYAHPNKIKMLSQICKKNYDKKIIIFNESNPIGQKIYLELLSEGLKAKIVNSDISKERQINSIHGYNNDKYNILITTKMFDEGYNLPSIDVPIIFSGNSTRKQAIQRIGRGLRKKENISHAYQIFGKDTFEEKYADIRKNIFKDFAEEIKWY